MKKLLIALITIGILLTACGNEETVELETEKPEKVVETKVERDTDEYTELPEYETIIEQVGSNYTFETVTDNEGNRILFLKDENEEKRYKTIFVKHNNRLEIIQINGDGGQVFEGVI